MTHPHQPGSRDPRQPFGTRDPRQPFGQDPTPPVTTGQFAPAQSRRPLWITLAALALVALVALAAIKLSSSPDPQPSDQAGVQPESSQPTGAASTGQPSGPTPGVGVPSSVPFTNNSDDATGTFEVLSHRWTAQGLMLTLRVKLDSGQQRLGFFALDNQTTAQFDPSPSGTDQLDGQTISAGQTRSGTVLFAKPEGATTVFMTASNGKQVAALKIA